MDLLIRHVAKNDIPHIVELVNSERKIYSTTFSEEEMDGIGIGKYKAEDFENNSYSRNEMVATTDDKIVGYTS